MTDGIDPQARMAVILRDLERMREEAADVEIPGWIIGHPSPAEADGLVTVIARSKADELLPFYPPRHTEIVFAVLQGSVRVDSGSTATLVGRKFFVLTAATEEHAIHPLEHPCHIFFMYFRTGVATGEQRPALDR